MTIKKLPFEIKKNEEKDEKIIRGRYLSLTGEIF